MATRSPVAVPRERIRELTEREARALDERTQASSALYERARRVLANGVASSYQVREPWPIYVSSGEGSRIWDVDGRELVDFHNGFGSMVQGHAHGTITAAVRERAGQGTHFAAPGEDAVVVAEELARRWGLPKWRYVNSGSEATMDAIRIARARTGRETIVKILGSYHGHHDYVMIGVSAIAGRTSRSVTFRNTHHGDAPELSAASSSEASIEVNAATPMRNAIGVYGTPRSCCLIAARNSMIASPRGVNDRLSA